MPRVERCPKNEHLVEKGYNPSPHERGGVLQSCDQVIYLLWSDLVEWRFAHGERAKPLTKVEIQPVSSSHLSATKAFHNSL